MTYILISPLPTESFETLKELNKATRKLLKENPEYEVYDRIHALCLFHPMDPMDPVEYVDLIWFCPSGKKGKWENND